MWISVNGKTVWHEPRPATDNCYDEVYLRPDVIEMSYMFEYCIDYSKKLYGYSICRDRFLNEFMKSFCREQMDLGFPTLFGQDAQDTFEDYITEECNGSISRFRLHKGERNTFCDYMYFWIGEIYVNLHFAMDIKSKDLIDMFPLAEAKRHFHLGHEFGVSEYCERIIPMIQQGKYRV